MFEEMNTDQLRAVFKACDRNAKGYLTCEDVKIAVEHLAEGDQDQILQILHIPPGGTLDFTSFTARVGKFLNEPLSTNLMPSPHIKKNTKTSALLFSPFSPILNSSEYQHRKATVKRKCYPASRNDSSPDFSLQENDDYLPTESDRVQLSETARRPKKRRRSRIYDPDRSSYSSKSTPSPPSSPETRVNSRIIEIAEKLGEVEESTVQTKHELSSIFHFLSNRSADLKEDRVTQQRTKLRELQEMEIEVLRMKMEGQQLELERLKTVNLHLTNKVTSFEQEKSSKTALINEQKEQIRGLEEKLILARNEQSSLCNLLEESRRAKKVLESNLEAAEQWRTLHLQQIQEAKAFLAAEQTNLRNEKELIIQERDILRNTVEEVYRDKEEQMIERMNLDMDLDKFRVEREQFLKIKTDIGSSRRSEEFVMIETAAEVDNILLENKILKENLDQLAKEKTSLQSALNAEKEKVKSERCIAKSLNKVRKVCEEKDSLQEILKDKERVIGSLMDVVENLKKEQVNSRLIKDHEKNLREITCKIRETADRMETLVINNNNFVENPTSRKLRGSATWTGNLVVSK